MARIIALHLPRPHGIYYGWYIVAAAVVAQFVAVGMQAYTAGVFLKPMAADLGWSREDYANAQTIGTFVTGGLGLFVGGLIDRRGARPLMIAGALLSGLCLIGLSRVHELWQFYLLRGVGITLGAMGVGNLVVNVTVAKWFVRRRGLAVAVSSMGVSLSGVVLVPVAQALIDHVGWRQAWVIFGVAVWLLVIPTAFVMRRTPEDYGLLPDGDRPDAAPDAPGARPAAVAEVSWTRAEAVRTPAIWFLIFAYGIANIGLGSLILHMLPFLTDAGFAAGTAAFLFSFQSWAALIAKPFWGVLMGRVHARYLSCVSFLLTACAVIGLLGAAARVSVPAALVLLFLYGLGIGGTIPLQETVWASYFGRAHLGKVRAVAMPFTILFSAMGPKLTAHLYDRLGDYTAAFFMFASFWVVGAVLVLLARPPRRRAPAPTPASRPAASGATLP
jgi:sugar phosphate permease